MTSALSSVHGFLAWWGGELLAFVPQHRRDWVRASLRGWTRFQSGLAVGAILVWAAAAALAPVMRNAELARLSADVARLRAQTRDAAALQDRLRILRQPDAAAAAMSVRPDPLDTLRRLSRTLPSGTVLDDLEIQGGHIRLSVVGGDARKAAAVLERSGSFHRVALQAPLGRGPFRIELSP